MLSYLSDIPEGPPDPIIGINESYKSCTDPRKVNVCAGAYLDMGSQPWVLPSMREAKRGLLDNASTSKEYAPIVGNPIFVNLG